MVIKNRIRNVAIWGINHFLRFNGAWGIKRGLLRMTGMKIGKGTRIVGPLRIDICSNVTIGEDCWIGRNFAVHGNADVTIGDRCDIAPEVTFATGTHKVGGPERRAGEGYCQPIHVGNGCWLGIRAVLLAGVSIGDGNIIGAGAVLTRSTEANALYAGSPAKKVKDI